MKKVIIFVIFIFNVSGFLYAQSNYGYYGNTEEMTVDNLLELHKEFNSNFNSISGYRIQIFKGSGNTALESAEVLMDEFKEDNENTKAYISFSEPYYRVRVGDFRTRLDALNFLGEIKKAYPSGFVIQDNIEFIVLPKYQKRHKL